MVTEFLICLVRVCCLQFKKYRVNSLTTIPVVDLTTLLCPVYLLLCCRILEMWFLVMVVSWIGLIVSIWWQHLSMCTSQASFILHHHRNCCSRYVSAYFLFSGYHGQGGYVGLCFCGSDTSQYQAKSENL